MPAPAYLLDTSICVYLLDGTSPEARSRVERQVRGSVATSAIAYAELVRGLDLEVATIRAAVARLFSVITVLPFDLAAAEAYRLIPFQRGRFDHLIAAHALSLGLTLVTNNERDFADVDGLHVENWTTP